MSTAAVLLTSSGLCLYAAVLAGVVPTYMVEFGQDDAFYWLDGSVAVRIRESL